MNLVRELHCDPDLSSPIFLRIFPFLDSRDCNVAYTDLLSETLLLYFFTVILRIEDRAGAQRRGRKREISTYIYLRASSRCPPLRDDPFNRELLRFRSIKLAILLYNYTRNALNAAQVYS